MSYSWVPSHLRVVVHQTRDLLNRSKSVSGEVYTQLSIEQERVTTAVLPRTIDALVWDQTFEIPLMRLDSTLHITVRQKSKIKSDDILGYVLIPLNNLTVSTRPIKNWYKLGARPGKVSTKLRGDLLLTISFASKWNNSPDMNGEEGFETRGSRSLQRSRSEKGRGNKDSPRPDKQKLKERLGGVFRRSFRRKNPQVFEDCNKDFTTFSVHTPDSPPTPRDKRKRLSLQLPRKNGGSPTFLNSSSSSTESDSPLTPQATTRLSMFDEASDLAKSSGVVDLLRTDPTVRREQARAELKEKTMEDTSQRMSPVFKAQPYRRRRPLGMHGTLPKDHKFHDSSLDAPHDEAGLTPPPARKESPITYRARASFRRSRPYSTSQESTEDERCTPVTTPEGTDHTHTRLTNGESETDPHSNSPSYETPDSTDGKSNLRPRVLLFSETSAPPPADHKPAPPPHVVLRKTASMASGHRKLTRENFPSQFDSASLKRRSADIAELLRLQSTQGKHDGLANVRNFPSRLLQQQRLKSGSVTNMTDRQSDSVPDTSWDAQQHKYREPLDSNSSATDNVFPPPDPSIEVDDCSVLTPPLLTPPTSATLDNTPRRTYSPSPSPELRQVMEEEEEEDEDKKSEEGEEDSGSKTGSRVKHTVAYKPNHMKQSRGYQPMSLFPPSMSSRSVRDHTQSPPITTSVSTRGRTTPPHTAVACNGAVRTSDSKQRRKTPPSKTMTKQQEQTKQQKLPARPPPPKISYDTGSLPRRPKQGEGRGGIKRALSFYQENKRQAQLVRERQGQGKDPIAATRSAGNSPQLIRRTSSGQKPPASVAVQATRRPSQDASYHTDEPCSPTSPLNKQSEATGSIPADKRVEDETDGLCNGVLPTRPAQVCTHHETESEGMGSSVTSEDTITEDTLQVWSKEELIHEVLKLRQMLTDKDTDLDHTKSYLDRILLRVMEENPSILEST